MRTHVCARARAPGRGERERGKEEERDCSQSVRFLPFGHRAFQLVLDCCNQDSWWTINGFYMPVITLRPGQLARWRLISASIDEVLELTLPPDCQYYLLGKDGVYVSPAPRSVSVIYLSPGSRADVIVRCKQAGLHPLMSEDLTDGPDDDDDVAGVDGRQRRQQPPRPPPNGRPEPGFPHRGAIATVNVVGAKMAPYLPPRFIPARPDYLADLTDGSMPPPGPRQPLIEKWDLLLGVGGLNLNGIPYAKGTFLKEISTGAIQEWRLNPSHATGGTRHPFHLHVWPFQIVSLPNATAGKNEYYQVGDWHDMSQIGLELAAGSDAVIRFQTATFNGSVVMHCHILAHEDQGMMGVVNVRGRQLPPPVKSRQTTCVLVGGNNRPCPKG